MTNAHRIHTPMVVQDWALLLGLALLWGPAFYFTEIAKTASPPLTRVAPRVGRVALVPASAASLDQASPAPRRGLLAAVPGDGIPQQRRALQPDRLGATAHRQRLGGDSATDPAVDATRINLTNPPCERNQWPDSRTRRNDSWRQCCVTIPPKMARNPFQRNNRVEFALNIVVLKLREAVWAGLRVPSWKNRLE